MRRNPNEDDSGPKKEQITLDEYLKMVYGNYPKPQEGMFIGEYLKLHQQMLDDLREHHQNFSTIFEKTDPEYYRMWLEAAVTFAQALIQVDRNYVLQYDVSSDGVRVGWAKTEQIYSNKTKGKKEI